MMPTFFAFVGWSTAGLPLLLLALIDALLVWRFARRDRKGWQEAVGLVAAQALACWLVAAFFTARHIGAGDSDHYSLQLADFLTQLKHGVFPVLVGQSEFGFNGNIHTVRTAPYYVHLGAVLYGLTLGRLTPIALQNLCVIVSVLGGGTTAYAAIRALAPDWRSAAPFLASLYLLCPALMVILIGMDMYPTIMVLPWLPLFWLGVVGILQPPNETRALIISTGALVLTWYAHPAIGAWLMPPWLAALFVRAVWIAKGPGRFTRPLLAGAAFGWLALYLFVSVSSLKLSYSNNLYGHAAESIFSNLRSAWAASWHPLTAPVGALGNIQLGYALLGVSLFCAASVRWTGIVGRFFAAVVFCFVLLLLPWAPIRTIWELMPDKLIDATNIWPMQRFYPIIAAAIPIWGALTLGSCSSLLKLRPVLVGSLAIMTYWGFSQEKIPRSHALVARQTHEYSNTLLAPGSVRLGRVSYLFFGFYPAYYSHGVTEYPFETRLLDREMKVYLDNAAALFEARSKKPPTVTLSPKLIIVSARQEAKRREATFKTDGHSQYLLEFSFASPPSGPIEFFGTNLYRQYTLPEFGEPLAFGAAATSSRFLSFCLPPGPPDTILLRTEIPGITIRVFAFDPEELPIKTRELMPLKISVDAPRSSFLETPRVFIPGYRATVNGSPTDVVKSPEGLVAVPVHAGASDVVVSYDGPPGLRVAFWTSLFGFGILPMLIGGSWFSRKRGLIRLGKPQN